MLKIQNFVTNLFPIKNNQTNIELNSSEYDKLKSHKFYCHEDLEYGHYVHLTSCVQTRIFSHNFYLKVRKNRSIFFQDLVLIYVAHTINFKPFSLFQYGLLIPYAIFRLFSSPIHFHSPTSEPPGDWIFYFYFIRLFYYSVPLFLLYIILILFKTFGSRYLYPNIR